jgi:hypothetical protein
MRENAAKNGLPAFGSSARPVRSEGVETLAIRLIKKE